MRKSKLAELREAEAEASEGDPEGKLIAVLRDALGLKDTIRISIFMWHKDSAVIDKTLRISEISFVEDRPGGGMGGSSYMQSEWSVHQHALIFACERYMLEVLDNPTGEHPEPDGDPDWLQEAEDRLRYICGQINS